MKACLANTQSPPRESVRPAGLRQLAAILGFFKLGYLALLCAVLWLCPDYDNSTRLAIDERWFQEFGVSATEWQEDRLTRYFATWDAQHYLYLSKAGYAKEVPSRAFYPLWPLAIRGLSLSTGGNRILAGMILSNLFSLAAWVLFYDAVARRFGGSVSLWATLLLVSFPGALFFQFIYSESLFFLLLMLLWQGLERRCFGLALLAAFLLPLARSVGAFVVLPLAWCWVLGPVPSRADVAGRPVAATGLQDVSFPLGVGLVLAPVLGFVSYLALLWLWTGDPFAGIAAQNFWGAHALSNLWDLPKFLVGYVTPTCWHGFQGSVLDRCAFTLLLGLVPLIWRLGKDLAIWTLALGILPAMSGTFVSFTRFESVVFPLFIALAVWLTGSRVRLDTRPTVPPDLQDPAAAARVPSCGCACGTNNHALKRPWAAWLVLALFAFLHAILVWRFVNFHWAG